MAELVPGHVITRGRTVEVARTVNGDFDVTAQINGAPRRHGARYRRQLRRAHPRGRQGRRPAARSARLHGAASRPPTAAPAPRRCTLDRIAIGGLVERSVEALVAQPGQLKTSLLGMSFLNRLQSWEVRGDRLMLHGYP